MAQLVKNLPAMQETQVRSLGWEDPLEEKMATHSSTLAWRIPWTEERDRLQSIELQRVLHDCVTNFHFHFHFIYDSLSSVQSLSCVLLFATPWIAAHQASLSITHSGVYSNSCPSSRCCHPAISSSVVPFSSCSQSLPATGSFLMSQLFACGSQSIGVSASTSILPMNTQDWSPSGWTSWISLQSKGLSRVFSNTTVQKYQFFGAQLSSQSNSHLHTWPLEKP